MTYLLTYLLTDLLTSDIFYYYFALYKKKFLYITNLVCINF